MRPVSTHSIPDRIGKSTCMHQLHANCDLMNPPGPRLTMRDVAAHLGISHATVSRALRDDPRISAPVRLKVQQEARKLGYRRDPKLAELMTHLRVAKHRVFQGTLAWVTNLDPQDPHQHPMISQFHPHAVAAAESLGYRLDCFHGTGPAQAPALARTFKARGISGVWGSMFWHVDYRDWMWDWRRFAFIHHGAEPRKRIVHVVDAEDRQNIQHLFETLAGKGYRRIGVATTHELEREALHELCAGRVRFAHRHPDHTAFPPCLVPALNDRGAQTISRWIRKHRVDCVVSRWRGMHNLLESIGLHAPQDIGLACVTVQQGGSGPSLSGIEVNAPLIARTAIENLAAAVEQGRFGLPDVPLQTLVPGTWVQGQTTR